MMLSLSKRLPFDLTYWAYIRLDLLAAKPHLASQLLDSGLRSMFCGIESWNPATGKIIGKGADAHRHINAVKHLRSIGGSDLDIAASFIVGLPEETVQSQLRTFELMDHPDFDVDTIYLQRLRISNPKYVNPLFQSKITKDYKRYGYEITDVIDNHLIWKNQHMDWQQAGDLQDYGQQTVRRLAKNRVWHHFTSDWARELEKSLPASNQSYLFYRLMLDRQNFGRELRRLIKYHWDSDGSAIAPVWHNPEIVAAWQDFYAQIKDPSWPDCQLPEEISDLPESIRVEIATTHVVPNTVSGLLFKDYAQLSG